MFLSCSLSAFFRLFSFSSLLKKTDEASRRHRPGKYLYRQKEFLHVLGGEEREREEEEEDVFFGGEEGVFGGSLADDGVRSLLANLRVDVLQSEGREGSRSREKEQESILCIIDFRETYTFV